MEKVASNIHPSQILCGGRAGNTSGQGGKTPFKPWLDSKSRRRTDQKVYWSFCTLCLLSIGVLAALLVSAYLQAKAQIGDSRYCLVLDEQFDGDSIRSDIWTHEQQTGGWGTGEFEWTTDSTNNSFVKDGKLYIVPTLTSDALGADAITNGYTLNLTQQNRCTAVNVSDVNCAAQSNSSTGAILPPVQSARLTTKLSKSIRFGKIEVKARMPTGDWIWPAIWMMPTNDKYGPWPASGEIDIFESKGNPSTRRNDGLSARMISTLHWGPDPAMDAYYKSTALADALQSLWTKSTHTFGLQWDSRRLVTWHTSRAQPVLQVDFAKQGGFWRWGQFPTTLANGTRLSDPWTAGNGATVADAAPFDQDFYLILSVAVGSTNGYFGPSDSATGRPWSDQSANPMRDFWLARDTWLPSWPTNVEERAMVVESVKIWGQC